MTCELTLKSAQDNAGGVCDKGDDVTYAIKAEQKWAAKVEFEAGKVKDQPLEWTLAVRMARIPPTVPWVGYHIMPPAGVALTSLG